jgi:hypothetical protein
MWLFGLNGLVQRLIDNGHKLINEYNNGWGADWGCPLGAAAAKGHHKVIGKLLAVGEDTRSEVLISMDQ